MPKVNEIDFFFDPISPYVFLAFQQIKHWPKEKKIRINFKPVLLAALLNHHKTKGPAEVEKKREYTFRDVWRWANHYGIEIEGPPVHPFNPLAPLRIITACPDEQRLKCIDALLSACWQQSIDISKYENIAKVLDQAGFDTEKLRELARSKEVKQELLENSDKAIEIGAFGVPTFKVGNEIFWGNDRLHFVEKAIEGQSLGLSNEKMKVVLGRPGIQRKT